MHVGTLIILLSMLLITVSLVHVHVKWLKSRPKEYIGKTGIRYLDGTRKWSDIDVVLQEIQAEISLWYDGYADDIFSQLIIEIVPFSAERRTYSTVVSTKNKVLGSIDIEREFFWSKKFYVAVCLQVSDTAARSALAHEILQHIVPLYIEGDVNASHKSKFFDKMTENVYARLNQIELSKKFSVIPSEGPVE